jgi:hypothetical protein
MPALFDGAAHVINPTFQARQFVHDFRHNCLSARMTSMALMRIKTAFHGPPR